MAHYALVENGIVTQVIVADAEHINGLENSSNWIQTSYNTFGGTHVNNTPLRKNYAGVGYTYDKEKDAFYAPQPYPSWTLDTDTCIWNAPVSVPQDNKAYEWDEPSLNWKESA